MSRKLLVIYSSIIVAILIAGLLAYSLVFMANSSQPEPLARITDFTADTSFKGCIVGVTTDIWFNVTVQNLANHDVIGANVTVTISGVIDTSICGYDNQSLGVLHANETRLVKAIILTDLSHFSQVAASNFTARLIVNGTVWDEKTYINSTPAASPIPTNIPTNNVTLFYHEGSRTEVGNNTRLVLVVNATLVSGDSVTIVNFKFFLYVWVQSEDGSYHLMMWRHFDPIDSGAVTLDGEDRSAVFLVTFEFPTRVMGWDGYFVSFSSYSLNYYDQGVGVTIDVG